MSVIDSPDKLPSVDRLLNDPVCVLLIEKYGLPEVTRYTRMTLDATRNRVLSGETVPFDSLVSALSDHIERSQQPSLRRVINLTGTVLHTNLGRAALPESAIAAMVDVARGASNLEFDLDSGKRGDRHQHCEALLHETGHK